ncbi:uncharacterized protein LOC135839149 isoform X2 [Planococcus citri]|uniref:uncharacterized protein LOC135839149 isoform X2 n=1 Tax=Planococcus citri TaxID=170843 RepID=UPI0031F79515
MKPTLLCFLFVLLPILHVQIVKSERYTSKQMLTWLNRLNLTENAETKKCLPIIQGKMYPDVNFLYMFCDTTPERMIWRKSDVYSNCVGYKCWESHLTDSTRYSILNVMNTYRTSVAEGVCGPWCDKKKLRLVFELKWSTDLENLALEHQTKFCGDAVSPTSPLQSSKKKGLPKYLDDVTVTFQVEEGFQRELNLLLRTYLVENRMNDWNEKTNRFRRSLATEVGCAYLLRYGVSMKTTLNEKIISGNFGHFSCVFGSPMQFDHIEHVIPPLSSRNCALVFPELGVDRPFDYLHRSLCTVRYPSLSTNCQFSKEHTPEVYSKVCPKEAFENSETWQDKWFGLTVRFRKPPVGIGNNDVESVECNAPKLPKTYPEEGDYHNYNCTRTHEVVNKADPYSCVGWNCEHSQLTDIVRHLIWHTINSAVETIAQGLCTYLCLLPCKCNGERYCNMAERRWHWYLEQKAAERVRNCPSGNLTRNVTYPHPPFQGELPFFEEVTVVFHLKENAQQSLHEKFAKLFWSNAFQDWNEDGTFRRGNAYWMGCAIVVRPGQTDIKIPREYKVHNGIPTHMVCIFATNGEDHFWAERGSANKSCCPVCTKPPIDASCAPITKNKDHTYPHLCSLNESLNIHMNCEVNKCHKTAQPLQALTSKVPGFTLIRYLNGSFEYVFRPQPAEMSGAYITSKMCNIATLLFGIAIVMVLLVISLIYKHKEAKKYQEKAELQNNQN